MSGLAFPVLLGVVDVVDVVAGGGGPDAPPVEVGAGGRVPAGVAVPGRAPGADETLPVVEGTRPAT